MCKIKSVSCFNSESLVWILLEGSEVQEAFQKAGMSDSDVGGYLLWVRRTQMWTQGELAEEAGVSPTTVSGIENGKISRPHFGTLRKLARVLEVDPRDFFGVEAFQDTFNVLTLDWARSARDAEFERGVSRASLEALRRLFQQLDGELGRLRELYGGLPPGSEDRLYLKGEIRHIAARSGSVSTSMLFHPDTEGG